MMSSDLSDVHGDDPNQSSPEAASWPESGLLQSHRLLDLREHQHHQHPSHGWRRYRRGPEGWCGQAACYCGERWERVRLLISRIKYRAWLLQPAFNLIAHPVQNLRARFCFSALVWLLFINITTPYQLFIDIWPADLKLQHRTGYPNDGALRHCFRIVGKLLIPSRPLQ